nr:MAG TPA: hypothetical protein [Caudoviricetes sp.]
MSRKTRKPCLPAQQDRTSCLQRSSCAEHPWKQPCPAYGSQNAEPQQQLPGSVPQQQP